jgi:hypothetical protein
MLCDKGYDGSFPAHAGSDLYLLKFSPKYFDYVRKYEFCCFQATNGRVDCILVWQHTNCDTSRSVINGRWTLVICRSAML